MAKALSAIFESPLLPCAAVMATVCRACEADMTERGARRLLELATVRSGLASVDVDT